MSNESNGWNEWSKHVLKELERLNQNYESLNNKIDGIRTDVSEEISNVRNEITKVKTVSYAIEDIKLWKKTYEDAAVLKSVTSLTEWKNEIDEVMSPSQLKEISNKVSNHEIFKTKASTVFIVVQTIVIIAFSLLKFFNKQ